MTDSKLRLHIGFDAKRAANNVTGLGNYSRYTIAAMTALAPDYDYTLFVPKTGDTSRIDSFAALPNVKIAGPSGLPKCLGRAMWRTALMTNNLVDRGIDLYHGLSNEIPLTVNRSAVTSVVTIHDLIWRRMPADYNLIDRKLYDFKYGNSAKNADRIIAISECTKKDIINDFQVDPAKIDVIYQGIDPVFRHIPDAEADTVLHKYDINGPYFIAVGTVQQRKNQLLAVKALRQLPAEVRLVIVGRWHGSYAGEIERYIRANNLSRRVIRLQNVPLTDLPALYSRALFAAYPSRYEGFGLPVVEAIACHTPVIAAVGSCLEEAGGPGAIYVDPDDADDFAAHANRLISNAFDADKIIRNGLRHIRRFNPRDFVISTKKTYQLAIISKFAQ